MEREAWELTAAAHPLLGLHCYSHRRLGVWLGPRVDVYRRVCILSQHVRQTRADFPSLKCAVGRLQCPRPAPVRGILSPAVLRPFLFGVLGLGNWVFAHFPEYRYALAISGQVFVLAYFSYCM